MSATAHHGHGDVPPRTFADFARGLIQRWKYEIPGSMLDYLTAMAGDHPIRFEYDGDWTPPPFDDVFNYCFEMSRKNTWSIPFGIYGGKALDLSPTLRVECWDGDTDSFREEGTLNIPVGRHVKENIKVFVLGQLIPYGTGVLVDRQQRVWIYNPPNAMDEFIEGTKPRTAAVVMYPGSTMSKTTPLNLLEIYEDSSIEFDPMEDGSTDGGEEI